MKINTTANAARSASPIAPMKSLQVKTGVRAGLRGTTSVPTPPGLCDPWCIGSRG